LTNATVIHIVIIILQL